MFVITLANGATRQFSSPITVAEFAASISSNLAQATIAAKVDDVLVDSSHLLTTNAKVEILTSTSPESLDIIRHSAAHLLAQAVKIVFPAAQVTIGPVIADGFYYDFAFTRAFTPEDLQNISTVMAKIVEQNLPITRKVMTRDAAINLFKQLGEHYKVEIIASIPDNENISLYQQGDFIDLCRGPHVPSTGWLHSVHLSKVSGAYWRGDAKNAALQRIYGTAWPDKETLAAYLHKLAEAEKRDHRKLGKQLDLFHFQEEAPGMIFWHSRGFTIYNTIKQYISKQLQNHGYEEVLTPQLVDLSLWQKSGHWEMFADDMFVIAQEHKTYAVKPMSCPCHVELFKQKLRSHNDLPVRFAEFGCVHRNEATGAMHGLMRVRQMTQDDGHIFCVESQIQGEALHFINLVRSVYNDFGFYDIGVKLSTRPSKRIGDDSLWDNAERALATALDKAGLTYAIQQGEGAFYGPKIEFHLKDCCDRVWQCGTLQLDYAQPQRLSASYVAADNSRQVPVMLHRAILGSIERFIGILLEHYAGKLPIWLAPIQVMVLNISERQAPYSQEIATYLQKNGIRSAVDLRNEKIGLKIREHTLQYIPYLVIVGDSEVATTTVTLRSLDGKNLGTMTAAQCLASIQELAQPQCRTSN